jgi:hypothetical protein
MRLSEFTNPEEYIPPATDAEDYLKQLHPILPDRPADDRASSALINIRQPANKSRRLFDARSVGDHVGGVQLRSRRGTSQWPTA